MVRDFHPYGKHLGALVLERLPPNFEHNIVFFLVLIHLVAVLRVAEGIPIGLWIKSLSNHSTTSLHCKQIEFTVSFLEQYTNVCVNRACLPNGILACFSANIAFDILIQSIPNN